MDILETKMKILQNFLLETIDGCILFKETKIDIIKVYVDSFNLELLLKVNSFWKGSYDHISVDYNLYRMVKLFHSGAFFMIRVSNLISLE